MPSEEDSTMITSIISDNPLTQISFNELDENREKLSKHLVLLNIQRNSLLPINKTIPDILYRIFTLAVFGSPFPGTTALTISHVCHHWRKSALESPILWGFVDVDSPQISKLFLQRSQDAPITLSWWLSPHVRDRFPFKQHNIKTFPKPWSDKRYFESCAPLFYRLDTLILSIPFNEFNEIRPIFQNSGQLRLRSVDIGSADVPRPDISTEWFEYFSTDPAYLRELIIERLPLPWTIPPHQKLTCLIMKQLPTTVNLLTFLSHCPLLNELEIDLPCNEQTDVSPTAVLLPVTSQTLDFPYLKILKLSVTDLQSYECILGVSSRIAIPRHLLLLRVTYIPPSPESPSKLFELVPAGTLPHFKDQQFLSISLPPREPTPIFIFCINTEQSAPNRIFRSRRPNDSHHNNIHLEKSFSFIGPARGPYNHSSIIDLIRGMPNIRHLQLISFAWELLTSWNIDFVVLFPHLTSLELYDRVFELDHFQRRRPYRDCTDCLTALSALPNTNIHTLILREVVVNSSILPDVALKIGMKSLRLEDTRVESEILATLSGKGVDVVVVEEDKDLFSPVFD